MNRRAAGCLPEPAIYAPTAAHICLAGLTRRPAGGAAHRLTAVSCCRRALASRQSRRLRRSMSALPPPALRRVPPSTPGLQVEGDVSRRSFAQPAAPLPWQGRICGCGASDGGSAASARCSGSGKRTSRAARTGHALPPTGSGPLHVLQEEVISGGGRGSACSWHLQRGPGPAQGEPRGSPYARGGDAGAGGAARPRRCSPGAASKATS